jgi:hypothetical protein
MVYNDKFIAVIKNNGKILRESNNNTIRLPFNSEYSLLLKNLESRRVQVGIDIDGQDVLFGNKLNISGNQEIELERFVKDFNTGNRFKFINKTKEIIDYRGDRIDDGIIRITFAFEKIFTYYQDHPTWIYSEQPWVLPVVPIQPHYSNMCGSSGSSGDVKFTSNVQTPVNSFHSNVVNESDVQPQTLEDEGITVPGKISKQQFSSTYSGTFINPKTIILRLKGFTSDNEYIKRPITVKTKITCVTCGRQNKSKNNFCYNCGTNLEIC